MCQIIEELADKRVKIQTLQLVKNLMDSMSWTAEQAMEAFKITEDDQVEILKKM
jgi:hypothetical protein